MVTVRHAVCNSRQRNSGHEAEQVKYRGTRPLQFPPPFPILALIHTSLSKERGHAASTLNAHCHCQASLMVSRNTTLVPPLRSCIGPASNSGLSTGTWIGHVPSHKERKKCRCGVTKQCIDNYKMKYIQWQASVHSSADALQGRVLSYDESPTANIKTLTANIQLYNVCALLCPRPVGGGGIKRSSASVVHLMSHTSALTRKPKGLGRRNFAQGYPRSHATPTPTSRSKVKVMGRGHIVAAT